MSDYYAGWAIPEPMRQQLLFMCDPEHPEVRCEHITFQMVPPGAPPPPPAQGIVRGMYTDEQCQALVVQVNGVVVRPSDGLLFHITVSHVPGFPSALVGQRMLQRPNYVNQIAPYPLGALIPFVRRIGR